MTRRSTSDRCRGSALLLVVVLGALAMGLWGASYRATHDSFAVEGFYRARQQRDAGSSRAVVMAGNLLRTGKPPSAPWTCVAEVGTSEEPSWAKVVFQKFGDSHTWRVEAIEATDADRSRYPEMPESFEEVSRDGGSEKGKKKNKKKDKDKDKGKERDKGKDRGKDDED